MAKPISRVDGLTMSSKEIAKFTGKQVGNVNRDIRAMMNQLSEGDDSVLNHVGQVQDSRGYTKEFKLRRRETDILLTGYSVTLRAAVIDRWRVLEAEVVKPPLQGNDLTRTIQEIADLVGSRRDNVKITV